MKRLSTILGEGHWDIHEELNKNTLKKKPLFITGHSLGGALATIAAKKISHEGGIAACYTFGSPRVGNDEWIAHIKAPIYRLVNAADCVPMLPPDGVSITLFAGIIGFLPYVGKQWKSWLLEKLGGYIHAGNMRYLTNCPRGNYNNVKLLYNVSFLFRVKEFFNRFMLKKFITDHSISIYRKKLMIIAENRN